MRIIKSFSLVILIGIAVVGLTVTSAKAAIITLDATFTGVSNEAQFSGSIPINGSMFIGRFQQTETRDAWRFVIPDLTGLTVTSANLRLSFFRFQQSSPGGPETFELYDVAEAAFATLGLFANVLGAEAAAIFDDLGSGSLYGTNDILANTPVGTNIVTALTAAAIFDINLSSSTIFVLGMRSTTLNSPNSAVQLDGWDWTNSATNPPPTTFQLELITEPDLAVIPLPAALPLFLTGLAGLALIRRRRRRV